MEAGMDLDALRSILTDAFPELSGSEFIIHTAGWDCVAVDVDDRLIFKFPRHELAEPIMKSKPRAGLRGLIRSVHDTGGQHSCEVYAAGQSLIG